MSMLPTNDSTVSKDFSDTIFTFDGVSSRFIKTTNFTLGTIEHYLRDILPTTYLTHLKPI
jgi:hypothetical protein